MLSWEDKSFQEQAEIIIGCFPKLTEKEIDSVIKEWSKGEFEDTWEGHTRAIVELQRIARWTALSEEQREYENALRRKQCQAYK